jgi:hypothetical protein
LWWNLDKIDDLLMSEFWDMWCEDIGEEGFEGEHGRKIKL